MSRKYKFYNKEGLYFVSFATVYWIDIFVREVYFTSVTESLKYSRQKLGLELYCWCIMPSHVHLIFRAKNSDPSKLRGKIKEHTSKELQSMIKENHEESRRKWLTWFFEKAGKESSNVVNGQLWQHHNKPIELWSADVIDQKVEYIHMNPVVSGFVREPEHWKYSSAIDYCGGKGLLEIDFV